jgi:Flp pilus assembly protein TadG
MPRISASAVLGRARDLYCRWRGDRKGIAAVEFAFIVPIMMVMFIGAVELSQAITVDRRVTQVASSVADLVARKETSINNNEINDILRVGGFIMAPYDRSPLQVVVRNVTSSSMDATKTKQSWQCTYSGAGANPTAACSCMDTNYDIPPGLVTTNDSVVVVEANYTYTPILFDYFLKQGFPNGAGGPGTYSLAERIFMKPRGQAAMLLKADATPCPSPTF